MSRTVPYRIKDLLRTPWGRFMFSRDSGSALTIGNMVFMSHLGAIRRNWKGEVTGRFDLGSGLTTNVGALALANDFAWAQNAQTLKLANYHATGTGTNAAAATDIALQTPAAPTATTAVTGSQTLVSAANLQQLKTSATLSYTSSLAITEWGLFTAPTLSATTGSPFTAATSTTATATGTPYTASSASVQGEQQLIVVPGTTAVWGLVLSNTTSQFTFPAWYNVSNGNAGATPGNTEAFAIKPVMWDHKVFSALNVVNGDTITFNYTLTINSGG